MWVSSFVGSRLGRPVALALDSVIGDIVVYLAPGQAPADRSVNPFREAFARIDTAFARFRAAAAFSHQFRSSPPCFAPPAHTPGALIQASERLAPLALPLSTLLETRFGVCSLAPCGESALVDVSAQIGRLTAEADQLLRSGDLPKIIRGRQLLVRVQALCGLLERFRQLRALAARRLASAVAH